MSQSIDFSAVTDATFNGVALDAINLNGTEIWAGVSFVQATGGSIVSQGNYKIHSFTSSGTFNVSAGEGAVEYLVVGGGGGSSAGGGGGGAVLSGTIIVNSSVSVSVGTGGQKGGVQAPFIQNTTAGGNSSAFGITANGGGAAIHSANANGGISGNGNLYGPIAYWQQSAGGGAGGAGGEFGEGGNGLASSITGSTVYYGGGGSSGIWGAQVRDYVHAGQGGNGYYYNNGPGHTDGDGGGLYTVGAGGGGGGAWGANGNGSCLNHCYGGDGGDGIVIIKYQFQ
jgi:hypothetical protein